MKQTNQSNYSRRPLRTRQISSLFERIPNICLFVIALESADFICQPARFLAQYLMKFSDRLKKLSLYKVSKLG